MQLWHVLHAACWKYRTQKWHKKSPSMDHCTTLSGYIFAVKPYIDNRKKNLLNSNISSTRPHNMANFGSVAAEIGSVVRGTPANFHGFCVLALLLQRRRSPEANQTSHDVSWAGTLYIHFRGLLPQGSHHIRVSTFFVFASACIGVEIQESYKDTTSYENRLMRPARMQNWR